MRISKCEIENFRGIKHLELDLDASVVVLLGENGSSKTSVLRALRVALYAWCRSVAPARQDQAPKLDSADVRRVHEQQGHEVISRFEDTDTKVTVTGRQGGRRLEWFVARGPEARKRTRWTGAKHVTGQAQDIIKRRGGLEPLPLLAYFGAYRRPTPQKAERANGVTPRERGYEGTFNSSVRMAHLVARWDRLSRQASYPRHHPRVPEAREALQALEECIVALIPSAQSVCYDATFEEPVIEVQGSGTLIPLSEASAGYRGVCEMGMDLALRALELNPALGAAAIRGTAGVVLIDEISLHLHPTWQRDILTRLRQAFPLLQFILATHSPLVAMAGEEADAKLYRMRADAGGSFATRVNAEDVGFEVSASLRNQGFGPMTTWGPRYLEVLAERRRLLSAEGDQLERLAENARRLIALRGSAPTHEEDVIRRLVAEEAQRRPATGELSQRVRGMTALLAAVRERIGSGIEESAPKSEQ